MSGWRRGRGECRARSRSRMRCWAAQRALTGTTSWFAPTAADPPLDHRPWRGTEEECNVLFMSRQLENVYS